MAIPFFCIFICMNHNQRGCFAEYKFATRAMEEGFNVSMPLLDSSAYDAIVESWDGTSWTEVNDLNTGRANLAGMGSQTLAITAGGRSPSSPAIMGNVETWNGSSWTETTDLNTARAETSGSGVPYNNVIVIGGEPSKANTEFWNGSTWTEVGDMATAGSRISQNMGASANATLAFLQASPSVTTAAWTTPEANQHITQI